MKNTTLTRSALTIATLIAVTLPINMGSAQAQAWETFSVNGGMALNTNNNFRRIDGQPRMTIWRHNKNDGDQQFERIAQPDGSFLLRHRSTNKCLNAHRLSNGAEMNVWNCNGNDPDQKFRLTHLGNAVWQIKRNGTNLCVDSPTRSNGGVVYLWECNTSNANQRWQSSLTPPPPSGSLSIRPTQQYPRNTQLRANNGYRLSFQSDGNLVLYTPNNYAVWATGTNGSRAAKLAMQSDGNVVLYDNNNRPMWASNTAGNSGAFLAIQTDGNMVIYTRDSLRPIFATNTVGGVRRTLNAAAEWARTPDPISRQPILSQVDASYFRNRPQFYMREGNGYASAGFGSSLLGNGSTQGNCTWYAYGRLKELGFNPNDIMNGFPNANQWTPLRNGARVLARGDTPQIGDVAQWYLGDQNHVAIVEKVENGRVTLSESHYYGGNNGILHRVVTYTVDNPQRYIRLGK